MLPPLALSTLGVECGESLDAARGADDVDAFIGQGDRDGGAESLAGAEDERRLAVETELHAPISARRLACARQQAFDIGDVERASASGAACAGAPDLMTPRLASTYLRAARPMPCCCS